MYVYTYIVQYYFLNTHKKEWKYYQIWIFFPIPNLVILFSYRKKVLLLFKKTNTDKLVFGQ